MGHGIGMQVRWDFVLLCVVIKWKVVTWHIVCRSSLYRFHLQNNSQLFFRFRLLLCWFDTQCTYVSENCNSTILTILYTQQSCLSATFSHIFLLHRGSTVKRKTIICFLAQCKIFNVMPRKKHVNTQKNIVWKER